MSSEALVESLLQRWTDHFNSRDFDKLSELYSEDASLFATLKPMLFKGRDQIRSYFQSSDDVTFQKWEAEWMSPDIAFVAGIYGFREERDGKIHEKTARFTFLLRWQSGDLTIVHHHSSIQP